MTEEAKKTRAPKSSGPKIFVIHAEDGSKTWIKAADIRVASEAEKIGIIDGAIKPHVSAAS